MVKTVVKKGPCVRGSSSALLGVLAVGRLALVEQFSAKQQQTSKNKPSGKTTAWQVT
jgi:hypothetical protein